MHGFKHFPEVLQAVKLQVFHIWAEQPVGCPSQMAHGLGLWDGVMVQILQVLKVFHQEGCVFV